MDFLKYDDSGPWIAETVTTNHNATVFAVSWWPQDVLAQMHWLVTLDSFINVSDSPTYNLAIGLGWQVSRHWFPLISSKSMAMECLYAIMKTLQANNRPGRRIAVLSADNGYLSKLVLAIWHAIEGWEKPTAFADAEQAVGFEAGELNRAMDANIITGHTLWILRHAHNNPLKSLSEVYAAERS